MGMYALQLVDIITRKAGVEGDPIKPTRHWLIFPLCEPS